MDSQQPEALRLADALDSEFTTGRISNYTGRQSSAELRRLHELAESEGRWASDYLARAVKAEALTAQMLEALEAAVAYFDAPEEGCFSDASLTKARAAIASAKQNI